MALAARALAPQPEPRRVRKGARVHRKRVQLSGKRAAVGSLVAIPLALVLAYVWLTAQLTAQTYRLHDARARQSVLAQQDGELRQQVARLESLPRLEAAAAALHMTEPSGVALIAPPPSAVPTAHITTIAASIADVRRWFTIR